MKKTKYVDSDDSEDLTLTKSEKKAKKAKPPTTEALIAKLDKYKQSTFLNVKKSIKLYESAEDLENQIVKELISNHDIIKHKNLLFTRSEYISFKNAKTKIIIDYPKKMNSDEDEEFKTAKFDHDPLSMFKKLTNVQEAILKRVNTLKIRGSYVFTASCGAGKTRAAMKVMEQLGVKTLIISCRNSVNDQWLKELSSEFPELVIEKRLDDKVSDEDFIAKADVYIMTPQYITKNFVTEDRTKYEHLKIDLIVYDELHSLTSAEFGKVLLLPFLMKQLGILKRLPLLMGMTATVPKTSSVEYKLIESVFGKPIESVDTIRDIRVDFTDYRDTQRLGKFDMNFIPLEDNEAAVMYLQFMLTHDFMPSVSRKLLIITSSIESSVFAAIQACMTFQKPVLLIRAANEKSVFINDVPEDYEYISSIEKAGRLTDDDPEYTVAELKSYKKTHKDMIIECDYMDYIKDSCIVVGTYHRLLEGFNCKEFVYGICTKFIWSPLKRVQLLGRIRRSSDDPGLNAHKRIFFVNSGKIPSDVKNPNRYKPPQVLYDELFEQRLFEKENYHRISLDDVDDSYTQEFEEFPKELPESGSKPSTKPGCSKPKP